jgi:hypothetical protein
VAEVETLPDVVEALKRDLDAGAPNDLVRRYAEDVVGESTVSGLPTVVVGRDRIIALWSALMAGCGPVLDLGVMSADGGHDVDVVLVPKDGDAPVRRMHRLYLDASGRIVRHVVHPGVYTASAPPAVPARVRVDSLVAANMGGFSGSSFYAARDVAGPRLIVKVVRPNGWMARATRDPGREALLVVDGMLSALPAGMRSSVLEAAPTAEGWVLVMADETDAVPATEVPVLEAAARLLPALRDLHRQYADRPPHPSLCSLAHRLGLFGPRTLFREIAGADTLPKTLSTLWEVFVRRAPQDIVDAVFEVLADPRPLLSALQTEPGTLLHGDYQPTNLLLSDGVVALDWGLAAYGPPELDFVWFLSNAAWGDDVERDELERMWTELTGMPRDAPQVDLSIVFHAAMGELGFMISESESALPGAPRPSAATVAWWLERTRLAFDRVGSLVLPV